MKDIISWFAEQLLKFQASPVENYLKFSTDGGINSDVLLTVINTIWGYFSVAGMGIAIIYFLMELNNKMGFENGNITLKTFAMPFAKLCLAIALLQASPTIMSQMLGINDNFVDEMAGITFSASDVDINADSSSSSTSDSGSSGSGTGDSDSSGSSTSDDISDTNVGKLIDSSSFLTLIGILLPLLLVWMVSMVLNLLWMYKALSYKLELIFKISLTPLAIVDCYNTNSTAVIRWVKSVLGLAIYGGMLMILSKLGALSAVTDAVESETVLDWIVGVVQSLIVMFVALGVSGTVKQVCKEALS